LSEVFVALIALFFKVRGAFGERGLDFKTLLQLYFIFERFIVESLIAVLCRSQSSFVAAVIVQHCSAVQFLLDLWCYELLVALGQSGIDGVEVLESSWKILVLQFIAEGFGLFVDELSQVGCPFLLH
jgi:hypothetical protein